MSTKWKLRGLYLFFYGSIGSLLPYLPLLFASDGISTLRIGMLLSISPFIGIFLPPLWSAYADKTGKTMRLIRIFLIIMPLLVISLYHTASLAGIVALLLLLACFQTALNPLADHVTLEYVQHEGIDYGRIRVFGSVGFSLASLTVSLYLAHGGNAANLYIVYVPVVLAAFAVSWWVKERRVNGFGEATQSPPLLQPTSVDSAKSMQKLIGFYFIVFCLSLTIPTYYSFFPLFLRHLHISAALLPLSYGLSSGSELFTMPFASKLYARVGPKWMLIMSALAYAIRWFVISTWTSPELIIGIQVLHGVAFGFFYTASVMYIRSAVPKTWLARGQGLFAATTAVGNVVGNIGGGFLYQAAGPVLFFRIQVGIALLTALLFFLRKKWHVTM